MVMVVTHEDCHMTVGRLLLPDHPLGVRAQDCIFAARSGSSYG